MKKIISLKTRVAPGNPKLGIRKPKPGLFFNPNPETQSEEFFENPIRNPTRHLNSIRRNPAAD
jgi:hypothetical protein